MPTVSVIIPVYNSAPFLNRCLNSVLGQDFKDFEIILVDDGSTDGSGLICDEYAENYSCIKVFHKQNEGASFTRKYGLDKSEGKYITFVDSDDWVATNYISILYGLIQESCSGVSACGVKKVNVGEAPYFLTKDVSSQILEFEVLMPRFFKYEFWGFWGKMYLKDSLKDLDFPKETISEDYYVMVQLFNKERKLAYANVSLYYYEHHEGSLSNLKLSERRFEEFTNVKKVLVFTKKNIPAYKDYALANVVGTAVKLIMLSIKGKNKEYLAEVITLRHFLVDNFWPMLLCRHLFYKTKILALLLLVYKLPN